MAAKKATPLPMAGNTEELERLEKDVAFLKAQVDKITKLKESRDDEVQKLNKEIIELRKSLEIAYDKIKGYEAVKEVSGSGVATKEGFVEIATMPIGPNNDIYPPPTRVDGIIVPRRKDEDGVMYECLPVKTALAIMAPGNGIYKRYLVGPCDKIEGDVAIMQATENLRGVYPKHFVYNKHKKSKDIYGKVSFIEVVIEESK